MKEIEERLDEAEEKIEEISWATHLIDILKAQNKRMFIIILVLIIMLVGTNMAWLYVFQSYDFVTYEQSTEGGGNANFIGNDGDIINGEAKSTDSN